MSMLLNLGKITAVQTEGATYVVGEKDLKKIELAPLGAYLIYNKWIELRPIRRIVKVVYEIAK